MAELKSRTDVGTRGADARALAQRLVRPFAARYMIVLATVAILVVVDQAIIQPQLVRLNYLAPTINVAGRQRMLSQKLSKEALALATLDDEPARSCRRVELLTTMDRWSAAHRALLQGSREQGLQPIRSAPIVASLRELEPHFRAMQAAATSLANDDSAREAAGARGGLNSHLGAILDHEPAYLGGMERTVGLLESASRSQVAWLRGCGLVAAAFVLLVLVGVYFAVLRAATQLVRRQVRRELRQRAQAEIRMRRLAGELAHASRVTALGQLAMGLAHEINQPLAAIVNYASTCELLLDREQPCDSRAIEAVAEMKSAASRAGAIVRRMRNFVRVGARQAACEELNDLVREVAELCSAEARRSDVEVTLELTSEATPVYVDALEIQQVLVNLFQNAMQAMLASPRGRRTLRVGTSVDAGQVRLDVADSGPGFAAGAEQDLFAPFFTTKPDGLGMGLSISRCLIERRQGRIWAEAGAGGGAVVRFSLPLFRTTASFDGRPAYRVCG